MKVVAVVGKGYMFDYFEAVKKIKEYCQNEDCDIGDCNKCPYPLSVIRCGDEYDYDKMQQEIKEALDKEIANNESNY